MSFLIKNDLNMLTPHHLGVSTSHGQRPRFPLNIGYIPLLLSLKDQENITIEILSDLNLFLFDLNITFNDIETLFNNLETVFRLRNRFLAYPLNKQGIWLELGIVHYLQHLIELLQKTDLVENKVSFIEKHIDYFPLVFLKKHQKNLYLPIAR